VYLFTNDLRLSDNESLRKALTHEPQLTLLFCINPRWHRANRFGRRMMGEKRYRFLCETLQCLRSRLNVHGQTLRCFYAPPEQVLARLHVAYDVSRIYTSINAGYDEKIMAKRLRDQYPDLNFIETHTHTLFANDDLPFSLNGLPKTFSAFRKKIEHLREAVRSPQPAPPAYGQSDLPELECQTPIPAEESLTALDSPPLFTGGEQAGQQHLHHYLSQRHASFYKETRNALDDFHSSTKFSPWLAQGCLSPRQILKALNAYELEHGANESSYWIYFELLWREYFQWYSHKHGAKLFAFSGITERKPLTSFYDERFKRWCLGRTPFPIINACMNQLNNTGYLSNRGRQLVASCFVNELALDWRYGAAYFEEQLIDYDVAANWGNWQYLAGVGADQRGLRRFNLEKQASTYDPDGAFTRKWNGTANAEQNLDSIDAASWPLDVGTDTNKQSSTRP
jgi:deoxyribodipyrimidine photo-lyase